MDTPSFVGPRTAEQDLLLLLLSRVEQLEAGHDSTQARLALLPRFSSPDSVRTGTIPLSFKVTACVWEDVWDSRGGIPLESEKVPEPVVALLELLDSQLDGRINPYYAFHFIHHTPDFSDNRGTLHRLAINAKLSAGEVACLLAAFDNPVRKIRYVSCLLGDCWLTQ